MALLVLAAYGLFLANLSYVLSGVAEASLDVSKLVVKTSLIAVGLSAAYLGSGIGALRYLRAARRGMVESRREA